MIIYIIHLTFSGGEELGGILLNFVNVCLQFFLLSPIEKEQGPSFERTNLNPLHNNALCQVWLKLSQWFRRRDI